MFFVECLEWRIEELGRRCGRVGVYINKVYEGSSFWMAFRVSLESA